MTTADNRAFEIWRNREKSEEYRIAMYTERWLNMLQNWPRVNKSMYIHRRWFPDGVPLAYFEKHALTCNRGMKVETTERHVVLTVLSRPPLHLVPSTSTNPQIDRVKLINDARAALGYRPRQEGQEDDS